MRAAVSFLFVSIVTAAAGHGAAADGEAVFQRCMGCHAIDYNRTGPKLADLFGRPAGSVAGYAYSDAMRASGIVWGAATLDRFLAAPRRAVPGTKMTYAGVADASERADLIAYLKQATAANE
jgi:cytochrome c